MGKYLDEKFFVILLILLSCPAFSNSKISFTPASMEGFYTRDFKDIIDVGRMKFEQNIINIGKTEFEFGKFYGGISLARFYDYSAAVILENIEDSIPVIGFYKGGSCFFPVSFGYKPLNKLSINLDIDILPSSSSIQTGPYISYLYESGLWESYKVYGIPIKYSMGLGIRYRLFENSHFSMEWDSGFRRYGYPALGDSSSGTVAFQGMAPNILKNPQMMETSKHKNNISFFYTGLKMRGPLFETGSETPSREMAYACIGCLHAISTLDLGYSQSSTSGRIKYIATDCALGALTGALEEFLHKSWVKKDDSDPSKLGKKILIGLAGGLIWEAGTATAWATNISSGGGGGGDYMVRDMLFFSSLQAGLAFRIGLSLKFEE